MERHMKEFLREGKTVIKGYIVRISLEEKKLQETKQNTSLKFIPEKHTHTAWH